MARASDDSSTTAPGGKVDGSSGEPKVSVVVAVEPEAVGDGVPEEFDDDTPRPEVANKPSKNSACTCEA